eukprot:2341129-Rhodomonas_salina.1
MCAAPWKSLGQSGTNLYQQNVSTNRTSRTSQVEQQNKLEGNLKLFASTGIQKRSRSESSLSRTVTVATWRTARRKVSSLFQETAMMRPKQPRPAPVRRLAVAVWHREHQPDARTPHVWSQPCPALPPARYALARHRTRRAVYPLDPRHKLLAPLSAPLLLLPNPLAAVTVGSETLTCAHLLGCSGGGKRCDSHRVMQHVWQRVDELSGHHHIITRRQKTIAAEFKWGQSAEPEEEEDWEALTSSGVELARGALGGSCPLRP